MGCRCCKMIQSYIFDPEEVQSPGCIHEANSYKYNEQGSNKSKFKENSEIQEHGHESQKNELNGTENKNQVNNTKDTLQNHGSIQEDGLGKRVAKLDVAVNGVSSCAGVHPLLNPNTNSVKEASQQGISSQSECSSASNTDFHTKTNRSGQEIEAGKQRKAACNEPNSIEDGNTQSAEGCVFLEGSAILDTQNNAIQLPDTDYPPNGNQSRNYVKKNSFSVNCAHSDQNTGSAATKTQDLCVSPPSSMKESSIESLKTHFTNLSEGITGGITPVAVTKAAQAPSHSNHKDLNGEIEEEDAEVAAALAALEAATAGEDLEDDYEY
ncbi:uncharacterized protein C4orf19 homolog [Phaenicophaeus curvirostris]|uniref:uncharacterized protein C4orf19 homolog n=1 Tax=Phaenicophaeus curvirostris TaxID=33595 RepID=UPI0037F0DE73